MIDTPLGTSVGPQSSSVRSRRFNRWALSSASTLLALAGASPAFAAPDACGPATEGAVTCDPSGNPYPTGIQYESSGSLTVNLVEGVVVDAPATFFGVSNFGRAAGTTQTINTADGVLINAQIGIVSSSTVAGGAGSAIVNNAADIQAGFLGIQTQAQGASIINNSGNISIPLGTSTFENRGLTALSFGADGTATVNNSGTVTLVSPNDGNNIGILARTFADGGQSVINNSGAINIEQGTDGFTVGLNALGFSADTTANVTNSGAITINSQGDAFGISTFANGDTRIDSSGVIDVTGASATGIFAGTSDADAVITINATGAITANSTVGGSMDAGGIRASTQDGDLTITAGSVVTSGASTSGISASSSSGDIIIIGEDIRTAGTDSFGIEARSTEGNIAIISDDVAARGEGSSGIVALSDSGDIGISSTGAVSTDGEFTVGIFAATDGVVDIVNTGAVTTSADSTVGILAFGGSSVTISGRGTVTVTGADSTAIAALSDGDVSVQTGAVSSTGTGILVFAPGNVRVDAPTVTTTQDLARGVLVFGDTGDVNITTTNVTTSGEDAFGIDASTTSGDIRVTSANVTTRGPGAVGISALTDSGDVIINSTGTVSTFGADATGIDASATAGAITITSGNVTTRGPGATGISAMGGTGNVTINSTGTVLTSGADADGIFASSTDGDIRITAQNVNVTGAGSSGIVAAADTGSVTVNSRNTTARTSTAILASSTGADATVNITGETRSSEGAAVNIQGGTTATVNVSSTGLVNGATGGIVANSVTGTTINNAGFISSGNANSFAIDAAGGPVNIANSSTVSGAVRLSNANDTFTNTGTFINSRASQFLGGNDVLNNSGTVIANADIDFGPGNDRFTNSGLLDVTTEGPARTITFSNLETFNNSGLIDLRNGRTGDVLQMTGTAFTGSGNSVLGLDVNFGATNTSDRLVVGNAQGSTRLDLAITGNPTLGAGPLLVQGGAGTSATAFVLPDTQAGLVQLELAFANNGFSLVGTPSDAAFRTTAFGGALRDLWHESADAWSAQMREGRDTAFGGNAGDPGVRFWVQGYARSSEREQGSSFTAFGRTRDVDLSYDQDFFGAQAGADFGGAVGEQGGFAFGVTGGYIDSKVNFAGGGEDLDMRAVNIGAYGRFSTGIFFINALGKYDHVLDFETRSIIGNFATNPDADIYGGKVEAGLRLGGRGLYVEPVASIAYVDASIDDFTVRGTTVGFGTAEGLRGTAGARVGTTFNVNRVNVANVYAGAHYVHEFGDEDQVRIASGANGTIAGAEEDDGHVRALLGVNVAGPGAVSGFIEGSGEFLNDREGYGVRGGLRIRF